MNILFSFSTSLLATLFCVWLLRPLAVRWGFVDRPGGRKHHLYEVPPIGGIAMFFGFFFALLFLPFSINAYRGLIAGSGLLLLMGIVDDLRQLGSKFRLCGQVAAALVLVMIGKNFQIYHLGNLLFWGDIRLHYFSIPFTIFCIMAYINAMNMVDGQDGLAGGVALGQTFLLMFLSWQLHFFRTLSLLVILAISLIVFLAFNMRFPWRNHASIFMGDAGSTFIAFLIASFAINIGQANVHTVAPTTILWVLAFPIFDLMNVSLHRLQQGKSLLVASHDHFHHILHIAGFDVAISTLFLCSFSLFLGILGLLLNYFSVSESWQFMGWFFALIIYFFIVKLVRNQSNSKWVF